MVRSFGEFVNGCILMHCGASFEISHLCNFALAVICRRLQLTTDRRTSDMCHELIT